MATQQVTPVTCPNCQAQFNAPIQNIIDGQDSALKIAFLQGSLNVAQCPQCGFTNQLNTPVLYYDLEKELAFVLIPAEIHLSITDQEKAIGNLTNKLVNSLPAEQRKFYLFNPKQFLSHETMVKAILEAEGITEEMMEAQSARTKLIEEFLQTSDQASLREKVKAHDAELDREFFEVLTALIQQAYATGNQEGSQALLNLRTLIAKWSTQGNQAVAEIDAELGMAIIKSQEELLEKLQAVENDEEFEALVAAGYPLLDYSFFQKLTNQIDAAIKSKDEETVNTLRNLRNKIVETKERQEAEMRAALQESVKLLNEILQSGQPEKALQKNWDKIDESFFMVLSANIEEAKRQNQPEAAQILAAIGNLAMKMLQERLSQSEQNKTSETEVQIAK